MLLELADLLIYRLCGLDPETKLGAALHFFVYDTVKIFLLLAVMIFAVGFVRTWLPQHRLKAWMSQRRDRRQLRRSTLWSHHALLLLFLDPHLHQLVEGGRSPRRDLLLPDHIADHQ